MRAGLKRGFTPPRVSIEGRETSITPFANGEAEKNPFLTFLSEMPSGISAKTGRLCAPKHERHRAVGRSRLCKLLPSYAMSTFPGADGAGRGGASRRTGLLPREDPRVHDSRFDPGTDPPDRPRGSRRIDADMQATMKSTGWKAIFRGSWSF